MEIGQQMRKTKCWREEQNSEAPRIDSPEFG